MVVRERIHKFPTILYSAIGVMCVLLFTGCADSLEPQNDAPITTSAPTQTRPSPNETPQKPERPLAESLLGKWTSADPGDPHLEFTADGIMAGSDGCNGVGGEFTVDEAAGIVTIERYPSTLIACLGVDDWLRGVQHVKVDEDDFLQVFDTEMEHLGQMYRVE